MTPTTTPKRPVVFMITGVARAGKDTLAAALVEEMMRRGNHAEVFKFATILKDALAVTLDYMKVGGKRSRPLDIAFTEDDALKPYVREALVAIGRLSRHVDSEIFARHLLTDIQGWIEFAEASHDMRPVAIIADWRYKNEYLLLARQLDAHIVTVEMQRPGFGPANAEEESSLKDLMVGTPVMHTRSAVDPAGVRAIAAELAHLYR